MHRLALALGYTVRELLERLTYEEFIEWVGYYEEEPWGSQIDGLRAASNTCVVYNAGLMTAAPKEYNKKPAKPHQFFIGIPKPSKKATSWQDMKKQFMNAIPKSLMKKVDKL